MLSGRDVIEEFISVGISPLDDDEFPEFVLKNIKLEYIDDPIPIPTLEVYKGENKDKEDLIARIEHTVEVVAIPYNEREHCSRIPKPQGLTEFWSFPR